MMSPVSIIAVPHNNRCGVWPGDLDPDGEPWPDPQLSFVKLPIPMPTSIFVTYGPGGPDDVLAIDILGPDTERGRVPKEDTRTVMSGVTEYNADLRLPPDTPDVGDLHDEDPGSEDDDED